MIKIITGDCREVLRKMSADSVHCFVCSPPYYGLRDYGIAASTWGGELDCGHDFSIEEPNIDLGGAKRKGVSLARWSAENARGGGHKAAEIAAEPTSEQGFCKKCGAWRGTFGLEPSWQMYIEHAVEIFEEARRVLRPDGVLWLNLGDSYATGAGAVGEHPGGGERGAKWAGRPAPGVTAWARHGVPRDDSNGRGRPKRADGTGQHEYFGPMTQPNRMPQKGMKPKDRMMIPARVAIALQEAGWWLRDEIIWHKPNPMPSSVDDRTTPSHEMIYLLTKRPQYYYDAAAVAEQSNYGPDSGMAERPKGYFVGSNRSDSDEREMEKPFRAIRETRNKRSVWTVSTKPFPEAHFATFPPDLIEPCILAGTSAHGCCPKCGAGWLRITAEVDTGRRQKMPDEMATYAGGHTTIHRDGREKGHADNPVMTKETIGFYPSCKCSKLKALPPYPDKPSRANVKDEEVYKRLMAVWREDCAPITATRRALCDEARTKVAVVPAVVCDPFGGAGTTALVADRLNRDAVIVELNPKYADMARRRVSEDAPLLTQMAAE